MIIGVNDNITDLAQDDPFLWFFAAKQAGKDKTKQNQKSGGMKDSLKISNHIFSVCKYRHSISKFVT
jgi:hypothetical protein